MTTQTLPNIETLSNNHSKVIRLILVLTIGLFCLILFPVLKKQYLLRSISQEMNDLCLESDMWSSIRYHIDSKSDKCHELAHSWLSQHLPHAFDIMDDYPLSPRSTILHIKCNRYHSNVGFSQINPFSYNVSFNHDQEALFGPPAALQTGVRHHFCRRAAALKAGLSLTLSELSQLRSHTSPCHPPRFLPMPSPRDLLVIVGTLLLPVYEMSVVSHVKIHRMRR
eukprot:gnl/Dysnectes_brevis/4088_a5359_857.p1 GENE.gnl/Dysnectes_brevis/4088_a5359_857~~gnl/Dysnectes_brevis/4088_a5359_857.p1  ORF type:complete len:224 (-),score=14.28 gnl/Dysnectes_brevis/4088_a5359_857:24-695(-)